MKAPLIKALICTALLGCIAAAPLAFAEPKEDKAESAWKAGPEGQRPPRAEGGKKKADSAKKNPKDVKEGVRRGRPDEMGMGMGDDMMPPPPPPMGGPGMEEMDRPARRLMQRFVQMRVENEKLSRMDKTLTDEAERLNDAEKGGKMSAERRERALKINGLKRELLALEREEFVAKVSEGSTEGLEQIEKLRTRLTESEDLSDEAKARMLDRLDQSQANIEKIRDSATDFETLSAAIKEVRMGIGAQGDPDRTEREREVIMRRLEELERRVGGPGDRPDGMMERPGMRRGPGGPEVRERMEGGEMDGPPPRRRGIDEIRERRPRPGGEEGAPPPPPPPPDGME